uniref:serine/Arginine-related protein 53 isoform X6 n=1 Tax=Callithrix jacchus TaxID=9483 RepID=UPI0023DD0496|nr:serine/Arginine-related protein 53 isoform X6 [Callithrix jacchus]
MTITTTTKTITLSSPTFIAFGINKIKINKPAKQTPNKKLAAFTIYFLGIPTAWQPLSMHSISRLMLPGARTRKALSLNWSKYGGGLRRPDLKKSLRVCGVCKSTESVRPKVWTQKWDVGHQILKKKAEAREKRNTVGGPPRAVLQIVEHTAERKEEGNQDQSQDLGPEIFSLAHILMIEDAGIDQAVALLMALEGNEVEVVQGVEGNPIEFRGLGQKAEQEGEEAKTREDENLCWTSESLVSTFVLLPVSSSVIGHIHTKYHENILYFMIVLCVLPCGICSIYDLGQEKIKKKHRLYC